MSLQFRVTRNGRSAVAEFAIESDARAWAKHLADHTYQRPTVFIEVMDMAIKEGRGRGHVVAEYETKTPEQCPIGG